MALRSPLIVRIPGRRPEKLAITNTVPFEAGGMQKRTAEWLLTFGSFANPLVPGLLLTALTTGLGEAISAVLAALAGSIPVQSSAYGFWTFTELFGWNIVSTHHVGGATSGALMSSGSMHQSPLTIMIPSGAFAASAEEVMLKGERIPFTLILRTGHLNGYTVVTQAALFETCRITRFQQQLDRLILHLTVNTQSNFIMVFNQEGRLSGLNVGRIDIHKNTTDDIL